MTNLPNNFNFDLSQVKAVQQEGKHVIIKLHNMKIKIYNSALTSNELIDLIHKGGNLEVVHVMATKEE